MTMGILKNLLSGGGAKLVDAIGDALDKVITSDEERNAAKALMEKLRQEPGRLQVELNKIEAAHRSILVAGWRPFIGWVCGVALAFFYVPKFIVAPGIWVVAIHNGGWIEIPPYPVAADGLFELVLALLGMSTLRTAEKAMGTAA